MNRTLLPFAATARLRTTGATHAQTAGGFMDGPLLPARSTGSSESDKPIKYAR